MEIITEMALKAGFTSSMVIDYPNSARAKKFYLILDVGSIPQHKRDSVDEKDGMLVEQEKRSHRVMFKRAAKARKRKKGERIVKDKNWVLKKKEQRRNNFLQTARDSR